LIAAMMLKESWRTFSDVHLFIFQLKLWTVALGKRFLASNKHSETKNWTVRNRAGIDTDRAEKRTNHLMPIKQENDTQDT